ncbi:MAG: LPS-assembly protein LptD [Sulfuriflexus sp.]|nr:LPS-assembly protein LptD [Sulfuriflexus sp.]
MKSAPKRLIGLLGTSLVLWHLPVAVSAADATGWKCTKSAAGAWICNAGTSSAPKPAAAPIAPISLPDGPVTPPAESLPVREPIQATPEPSPEETKPAVVAKPAPAPTPTPEPKPTPAPVAPRQAIRPAPVTPRSVAAEDHKPAPTPTPTKPIAKPQSTQQIGGDGPWALCPPVNRTAKLDISDADRTNTEIKLSADSAELAKDGVSTFRGNVEIMRADQRLLADSVDYDRDKEIALAKGNVSLEDNTIAIRGDELKLNLKDDKSTVRNAKFDLYDKHGRGEAEKLRRDGVKNTTRLKNTTYTTCPAGNNDWQLNADKIKLNHNEGFGLATNVSVNFKGIPFFYAPIMTFPIDNRRKSGFLTPAFGSSDESGAEFSIPYYWNIAANRDATITPRILGKRGFQLGGEYRYLSKLSEGTVSAEYLASDNEYNDEDRYLFSYQNTSKFTPRFQVNTDLNYASDKDYFEDLGSNITLSSTTHLERRIDATYSGDFWNVTGRVQGYQTIDRNIASANRPYERLPQVVFNANLPDQHFGLDYGLRAEAVHFNRDNSVTGTRFDIQPSISLPLRNSYGYITPKVGFRYTKYDLDDSLAGRDSSPDRSVPIFSIDSGLYFDRDTSFADRAMTQTLEPRLYYLKVPKRNQDNLIVDESGQSVVFDSGLFDFSFDQLFRENRFSGADRVGDADQLTAAVTTRFIDKSSGIERASASIGQIYYFDDREVTLPNGLVDNDNNSDIVAEVSARFTRSLSARAGIQWDPNDSETDKGVASVRYQSQDKHIINFAYRHRRDLLEQTDLSVNWPLSNQWNAVARWNYALDQDRTIDAFAGLEYENCCWIARVVGRQYINDLSQDDENFAILFQLELKGLTSFGDRVKKFLGRGILGYDRESGSDDDNF